MVWAGRLYAHPATVGQIAAAHGIDDAEGLEALMVVMLDEELVGIDAVVGGEPLYGGRVTRATWRSGWSLQPGGGGVERLDEQIPSATPVGSAGRPGAVVR